MPVDQYNLTDGQKKAYSEITRKVKYQQDIIRKATLVAAQRPSYEYNRAINSVDYHTKQLEEVEDTLARRIEKLKEEHDTKKKTFEKNLLQAKQRLEAEKAKKPKEVICAEIELESLAKELKCLGLPELQESIPSLTPTTKLPEGFPSRDEFMSEGFDEEEAIRKSRARRGLDVEPPPEKKQEPVNYYDSSSSEDEESEKEDEETLARETAAALERQREMIEKHAPIQKMDRYQPESQGFPPTITNTKIKKPVRQVLKR